ncbi:diacylglycerol/lipid kinase family protein [Thiorhodovibrio frisius]|uniref:Sphingosine/diacylglycerol kinase-like enzyme n=1 Tax=Thiorhodovibrio frisius TaxID=631362 RepID=H8Z3F4_9GAMM|nr:diacylglycerol kinase family protein [Thiorhodovibrio frisius]EIC21862.1 sphingosine/diacylglycerol kinase-like enzyme [Thiorhodovibrio frisius]WPL21830.1 Putative lipid kinase BmrU [Thiorhodovibrio frisius]
MAESLETDLKHPEKPPTARPSFWSQPSARASGSGRVLAVVNPSAGELVASESFDVPLLKPLQAQLSSYGVKLEQLVLKPQGFGPALRARLGDDLLAIYVFGGDGTVLAVVEALGEDRVPIAILPQGTMNWMARDLGIPAESEQAMRVLLDPEVRLIDLGQVNGHPFLCACMLGIAALLARYRERDRHRSRWWRWPVLFFAALRLWGRYPYLRMTLVGDGERQRLRSRTLVVVNNRLERALRRLPFRDRLDGGVLELYAMRRASVQRLRALLGRLMAGSWGMDDVLLTQTSAAVRIEVAGLNHLPVLVDGEIRRLQTPLSFSLQPRTLPMLVPREDS